MKMKFTKHVLLLLLPAFFAGNVMAQEVETFTLDPSELEPDPEGYYVAGAYVDDNDDGEPEFYNGCLDFYGDSHHMESDTTENGFIYGGAMVMPDCEGKGTPPTEDWPEGYLQLGKHKNAGTEDAEFGYIISPAITNLQSLEIMVGTDVSIGSHREAWMMIESSLDDGETWDEGFFIRYQMTNQGGDIVYYEADGESPDFNAIVADSQEGPVRLRISTTPADPDPNTEGQRLKIFGVEIVAEAAGDGGNGPVTSIRDAVLDAPPFFEVTNGTFVANQGELFVHTITGALVGSGRSVNIPGNGLYIVRSDKGAITRIGIQND